MKRQRITLEEIADQNTLITALYKAARGKQHRRVVRDFYTNIDVHLAELAQDILQEKMPYGRYRVFHIHDPKKRRIHAACFEDRIFHHAVMHIAGPHIEKSMVYHSYACRPEKGVHKAIEQVQVNLRRYSWFVKIDGLVKS